jgi:cell division protein FtsQ
MDRFDYNQPNTRARIAARRKALAARSGSAVIPGPRRAVSSWLATGRVFSLLLFVASLGGLLYIAMSPRFTVKEIQVEGAQALSQQAVARLAGARDQSIWLLDTRQIVERLKTNAYVEEASASVSLPDRLTISVAERRPEVRWQAGGALYLVDASGRVLDADRSVPVTNTLVIEDRSTRLLQPNDHVDPDALRLGRLLAVRLPAELNLRPARIGWDIGAGIFVTTAERRTIIFGRSENLDTKLAILGKLLKDATPFTLLDLRPSTPFYRNDVSGAPAPSEAAPTLTPDN